MFNFAPSELDFTHEEKPQKRRFRRVRPEEETSDFLYSITDRVKFGEDEVYSWVIIARENHAVEILFKPIDNDDLPKIIITGIPVVRSLSYVTSGPVEIFQLTDEDYDKIYKLIYDINNMDKHHSMFSSMIGNIMGGGNPGGIF